MKLRTLAVAGAAMFAFAGCSGGTHSSANRPAATPSARDAHQALIDATKCMRANGYPDWPDPVTNDSGDWVIPDSAPDVEKPAACADLFRAGKGGGQRPSRPPLSAEELAKARRWAECIRAHNVPTWPDPDSEGYFEAPDSLQPLDSNTVVSQAMAACTSSEPTGGIKVKGSGPTKPANH
ncbi:hypothetical protein [Dactylosporangium sp. NPDC049140]|uniref:hypothetical protein n=1 Tax=Dactylosporangium sp. NPDC049140 TaxID=3155647 RepID=UPI0033D8EA05